MKNTPHDDSSPELPSEREPMAKKPGRWTLLIASTALAISAAGILAAGLVDQEPAPPQAAPATTSGAPQIPGTPTRASTGVQHSGHSSPSSSDGSAAKDVLPASPPVRIAIPSLHVNSSLERLGLNSDDTLQTPKDPNKAGWFTKSPAPGARGPAILAGHVTWNGKPGVFFNLGATKKGAQIEVSRKDGRTAVFTVERTARYPKNHFPTLEVYGNLDHAGLRLITCGGTYSSADHRYADNVVVYASLTAIH